MSPTDTDRCLRCGQLYLISSGTYECSCDLGSEAPTRTGATGAGHGSDGDGSASVFTTAVPVCCACGSLVGDEAVHRQWHQAGGHDQPPGAGDGVSQETLFSDLSGGGRRPWNPWDTEKVAADEDRTTIRAKVLDALRAAGTFGLTDDQIAEQVGAYRHSCATRRKELSERGWNIQDTGRRLPSRSGRPSIVWYLAP